jgi:Protochlamydia outer membrane protein
MSQILIYSFFLFTFYSQVTFSRNVYFFDKENKNDASIQLSTTVNQTRKVYVFDKSEIIRKKTYEVPAGYTIKSSNIGLGTGYRNGDLNWNFGDPNGVDVISELEWDDMDIAQFSFNGNLKLRNNIRFGLDFGFGIISDGDSRDSDYNQDNRQGEFSRSFANVGGHDVIDVSTYLGYEFTPKLFNHYRSTITPLIGYSYHEQNIQFEDGVQIIPATGPFSGVLDSEYRASWYGPWIGFEFEVLKNNWSITTQYSHHWAEYYADATWNLRTNFAQPKSFEQISEGEGDRVSLTLTKHWKSDWDAFLNFGMETWDTSSGLDRVFFANGNVIESTLNEANWDSWWAGIGVRRSF